MPMHNSKYNVKSLKTLKGESQKTNELFKEKQHIANKQDCH